MTNFLLDLSGRTTYLWFLCILYVGHVLYCLAHPNLAMRTPTEAALSIIPDVSALLCFVL